MAGCRRPEPGGLPFGAAGIYLPLCVRSPLAGSAADSDYPDRLYALLEGYGHPVLFCAGAATLSAVAKQRERFAQACDFLIPTPEALDALNDKEAVHRRCRELGIPVPRSFDGEPDCYPVIIKPHCGEKFGLKAQDRYAQANNAQDYEVYRLLMSRYDPSPIVQEKVEGTGAGASLLLDREGRLLAYTHQHNKSILRVYRIS